MWTTRKQLNILLRQRKKVRHHSTIFVYNSIRRYSDDFVWFYKFIGIIADRLLSGAKLKVIKAKILILILFLCTQNKIIDYIIII